MKKPIFKRECQLINIRGIRVRQWLFCSHYSNNSLKQKTSMDIKVLGKFKQTGYLCSLLTDYLFIQ